MAASQEVAVSATPSLSESVSRPSGTKILPSLGFLLVTGGLFLMDAESLLSQGVAEPFQCCPSDDYGGEMWRTG
ncbi:hypothetical protein COMA2_110040 [Candidatus Nitrospira nitrificans]|uniref:Uncharacterized protein n=1 Tax=Candidatus Nitrospira nitrificans TaxID=1742973 RepID=A0A0S4L685_9BACT|nr:hypothetical protein COMA2_110040 [Candidatus Nitrospira nitrificans]